MNNVHPAIDLALDLFRNSLWLIKSPFLASLLSHFSTICAHMLSKFANKFAQKSSIFSTKASFDTSLLRDIHLPDPISWWPLAVGWWMVIGCSVLIIFTVFFILRQLFRQTLKKQAIKKLDEIEMAFHVTGDASACMKEISMFLRRIVITQNPKNAGVTGQAWLKLLDASDKPDFSQGTGQLLLTAPYQSKVLDQDASELIELCRKLVKRL